MPVMPDASLSNNAPATSLLCLPSEIRQMIYCLHFKNKTGNDKHRPALLASCKIINHEASEVLKDVDYSVLDLYISRDAIQQAKPLECALCWTNISSIENPGQSKLYPVPPTALGYARTLRLHVCSSEKNGFLVEEGCRVLPMSEICAKAHRVYTVCIIMPTLKPIDRNKRLTGRVECGERIVEAFLSLQSLRTICVATLPFGSIKLDLDVLIATRNVLRDAHIDYEEFPSLLADNMTWYKRKSHEKRLGPEFVLRR